MSQPQPTEQDGLVDMQNIHQRTNLNGEREGMQFFCTKCQQIRISRVEHNAGTWTYICCLIWCLLTFLGGLIPFCCNPCKDVKQYCPECQALIGEAEFKPI